MEDEPYEEWALLRREALKDAYLTVLGKLAERCKRTGDLEGCIGYSQKILAKDCCREDAYRSLVLCYGKMGQRSRALHWYDLCVKTLRTELDAEPDAETVALRRALLGNGVPGPGLARP